MVGLRSQYPVFLVRKHLGCVRLISTLLNNTSNASGSLISDNVWWFECEARVEHSRKTGEETWVKVTGWIGDPPGRIGTEDFYISPEDVDEGFGDDLEDACKENNEDTSIVITTRITQSTSPIEMPYD